MNFWLREVGRPSGRASNSGAKGRGVRSALRSLCCVLEQDTFPCCVLEQDTFTSQTVLAIPRKQWVHPDMTEKLFTGTLSKNSMKNEALVYTKSI